MNIVLILAAVAATLLLAAPASAQSMKPVRVHRHHVARHVDAPAPAYGTDADWQRHWGF